MISIPIARSITHDDPTGLPRLALRLQCRSWHPSYDPVWLDRAPVAGLMRDELELCYVQKGFRPSFRRGHGQVVHSYRDTERLKVFL